MIFYNDLNILFEIYNYILTIYYIMLKYHSILFMKINLEFKNFSCLYIYTKRYLYIHIVYKIFNSYFIDPNFFL